MQLSTIFSILMILLNRRKVSRDYLAERFSVSVRTVSRYLTALEDAGVPILSSPGIGGGVYLADDFTLDKTFLSEAETLRLKSALERTETDFGDRVNRALIEKLDAVNKTRERDSYVLKQDNLFIDGEPTQAYSLRPKIKILENAIDKLREVDIKYTDSNGYVSYRSIQPYTLVFKMGAWYIYAMCRLRGDFRLFKLTRISDLRMTSKSFIRYDSKLIEKLDLEFYNEVYVDLEFELAPVARVREKIADWLGAKAISERGTKLIARAEVPLNDALYTRLLSYGSSVKILAPREIADRIKDEARLMLASYE